MRLLGLPRQPTGTPPRTKTRPSGKERGWYWYFSHVRHAHTYDRADDIRPPRGDGKGARDVRRRTGSDRPHRGADAREPFVRPHARLPVPGGRAHRRRRPRRRNVEHGPRAELPRAHRAARTSPSDSWDPDHSGEATDRQIGGDKMDGFAESFARTLAARKVAGSPTRACVMGYFNAADLPVYDHLAEHFCVCDRWHSSVPGATWPNRLYARRRQRRRQPRRHSSRRSTASTPSSATSTPPASPGAGTRTTSARCAVPTATTCSATTTASPTSTGQARLETALEELALVDEDSRQLPRGRRARPARRRSPWIDPNFKDLNLVGHASRTTTTRRPTSRTARSWSFLVYNALASRPAGTRRCC